MTSETVSQGKVISMNYTLKDDKGNVLDESRGEPLEYLQGHNNIIPGLERELEGLKVGDRKQVSIQPTDGYGEHDPNMIFALPISQFNGQTPQPGMMVQLMSEQGMTVATIVKVEGQNVVLDANHPLAGQVLNFDVEIVGVRTASTEELSHGHPHGPNGHHH